jgi:hypothetical protein
MADLVNITNFKAEYTENLLTPFCNLDDDFTWNTVTGGSNAVVSNSTTRKFDGLRALRVDFTGTSEIVFNSGGSEMNFTAPKDGIYTISARFFKELVDITSDINVSLYLFKNGISSLDYDLAANLYQSSGFIDGVWNCYAQPLNLLAGDVISFNFKANSDTIGAHFYIDGLKIEYNDRQLFALPAIYTRPIEKLTGWQSKTDTINTQNLTADTDNLIAFTGVDAYNVFNNLIDSVGKITPISLNDALNIDFVFSFVSPVGGNDFLSVKLKVNGVVYRAQSFRILEPTGETNYISVSFSLAVMQAFKDFGGELFVKPSTAITIENRYLQVARIHKGI